MPTVGQPNSGEGEPHSNNLGKIFLPFVGAFFGLAVIFQLYPHDFQALLNFFQSQDWFALGRASTGLALGIMAGLAFRRAAHDLSKTDLPK